MRLALALVTLACAGSAAAEPVQDRYGPPRKAPAPQARAYEGRLLDWAGKAAPQPPRSAPVEIAARPEPQPLAREFRAAAPVAPAPPPAAPARVHPAAVPLPQSLYDAPAAPPAPRVTQVAAAPPPPAPQSGAAPSRLYSLHREYGMAPDTVPVTPSGPNYVLIGPSETPPDAEEDEATPRKPPVDARLF